jgi:hypothetical protein
MWESLVRGQELDLDFALSRFGVKVGGYQDVAGRIQGNFDAKQVRMRNG